MGVASKSRRVCLSCNATQYSQIQGKGNIMLSRQRQPTFDYTTMARSLTKYTSIVISFAYFGTNDLPYTLTIIPNIYSKLAKFCFVCLQEHRGFL